jgi:hypothetical protein
MKGSVIRGMCVTWLALTAATGAAQERKCRDVSLLGGECA